MAGPGKRGKALKRPSQDLQHENTVVSSRGSKGASKHSGSMPLAHQNEDLFPLEGQIEEDTQLQRQAYNSPGSTGNEASLITRLSQDQDAGQSSFTKRGATRNISLARKRQADQILTIEVDQDVRRIVGKDSQYFISESGCLVRKMARLNVQKWSRLDENLITDMARTVKDGFQVDDLPHTKVAITQQMNRQYRSWRYRLHLIFLQYETKEEAMKHVPENVSESDWIWLCEYFSSEEFKMVSDRNKKNRAEQETPTTVGTKSLARVVEEKRRKDGIQISEIELYELSRTSKKKGCLVNETAKEKLEKMKEKQATTSMTSKEICLQELGYIPGQKRQGINKKEAALIAQFRAEIDESRRKAVEAEERSRVVTEQFNEEIKRLKEQQAETTRLCQELAAKLKDLGQQQLCLNMLPGSN